MGSDEPMSSEELAHWHWVIAKHNEPQSMKSVVIDVRDLVAFVAEVERLRALTDGYIEQQKGSTDGQQQRG